MFGIKPLRGGKDRERIQLNGKDDVLYWTQALNTTEEELRTAMEFAGETPDGVRDYLRQHQHAHA